MFSGIVEEYATLVALVKDQENIHFTFKCSFVNELKIDQSISHNGVCLTVVDLTDDTYTVTAMKETLERSNLGLLKVGDKVNVERSMMMNGRLDGHIVQGHVDQTATCVDIKDADGSWYFTFKYAFDKEMAKRGYITVDKGSVTVNGVSLTVCNPTDDTFQVAIIPYTYEHTNFHTFVIGSIVNIEFDIVGKYISIEKLIEDTKEVYYDSLQKSSIKWHENANDYEPFVKYMLGVIVAAYRDFSSRVKWLTTENLSKPERIREIIRTTMGTITKSELLKRCPDISQVTVQRTLAELMETDEITKIGGGRYTKYTWNNK